MASAAFSLAPFFQEPTICRPSKEVSTAFPGHGHRCDILKSASVLVGSPVEEKGLTMNLLPTYSLPQISIPMVEKPFLIDMQDGRMLLTGAESEIKDLISVATEFNVLKSFTTSNKQSMVVPYFTRSRGGHARARNQGSTSSDHTVAPSKSPADIKLKPSPKKKGKHGSREREFHETNYFRACENFLSLVVDKKRTSMDVIALKKSGPEITQLISQFGAGVAGTGLAILISAACKTASGRASLNAAKFMNAGLGIGFLYLSWSVARLRDAVAHIITRSTGKLKLTEDEMSARLDRSVKEVLYRAAALAAIALLRLA